MQFHAAELSLYQVVLADGEPALSLSEPSVSSSSPCVEILRAGLISAKLLLDLFVSQPRGTEVGFTNSEWIQVGFAFIIASKLSVCAAKPLIASETVSLRASLDMSRIFVQSIERISNLRSSRAGKKSDRDVFLDFEKRIKSLQRWYENQPQLDSTTPKDTLRSTLESVSSQHALPLQVLQPLYLPGESSTNTLTMSDFPYSNGMFDVDLAQYFPELDSEETFDHTMQLSFDQL